VVVSRIPGKEEDKISLKEVLLATDGDKVKIGKPFVAGAVVTAKLVKQSLGEKLHVYKFKAKTGYRRKLGFRPHQTVLLVEKISL